MVWQQSRGEKGLASNWQNKVFPSLPSPSLTPSAGDLVTSRNRHSAESTVQKASLWMSQPMHESGLYTTHSLYSLGLATSLIFSFLVIKWRQYSFLGGFEDQKGDELTLNLLSLLFLTPLENLYRSLVPANQSSKQEKIWPAKEAERGYIEAEWTVVT